MYGLDTAIDLSFLKSREVIQIAIGVYQVIFAFDDDTSISVEGEFRFVSREGSSVWQPGTPQTAVSTLRLLGATVEWVNGQKDALWNLHFPMETA